MTSQHDNSVLQNFSALVDFSNLINSSLDLKFALNNLLLTAFGKFLTTKGLIALKNSDGELKVQLYKGLQKEIIKNFPATKFSNESEIEIIYSYLDDNGLNFNCKIITHEGTRGIIALGNRLSKQPYSKNDKEFLKTLVNIGATAIENSLTVQKLKLLNKDLDSKVNQLSALFDLSKEFSGVLEIEMISKLLVFSIIGQLLVSKFAVIIESANGVEVLESKYPESKLANSFDSDLIKSIKNPIYRDEILRLLPEFEEFDINVIIPMQVKKENKGVIILGERKNSKPFSQSDIEFAYSIGSLAIISIENARLFEETLDKQKLEKELETARAIQKNLLPSRIPQRGSLEIAAINQSAKQVGGDYYELLELDSERLLIAIGDVSGKGVQAALLMANLQAFLKSIWKQNITLSEASNLLNDLVSENTSGGSFITFFWGIINSKKKELEFVNAGHNPPLLVRNKKITYLKKGGMILGVMPTIENYKASKVNLNKDDVLVLFTDGITEAMDRDFNEYTDKRLETKVKSFSHLSASELLDEIVNDVKIHTKLAEQSDDITALIIKVI